MEARGRVLLTLRIHFVDIIYLLDHLFKTRAVFREGPITSLLVNSSGLSPNFLANTLNLRFGKIAPAVSDEFRNG